MKASDPTVASYMVHGNWLDSHAEVGSELPKKEATGGRRVVPGWCRSFCLVNTLI